jgi:hypothetical protein
MKVRDELAGKKVKCPGCGGVLVVSQGNEELTEVTPKKAKAAPPPLPERDEAPRKKTREVAEEEKKPVRKAYPYWRCKSGSPFGLLALADDGFYFGKFDKEKHIAFAEEELSEGEPPEQALGDNVVPVPLEVITLIECNKHHSSLTVHFAGGEETVTEDFVFEERKDRDRALKALRERLEPEWEYIREDYTPLKATVAPLVTIGILLVVTGGLAWLAHWLSSWTGSARVPAWAAFLYHAMMFLGPLGIIVVGGVLILPCVWWLVVRVMKPPIMVRLTPPPKKEKVEEEEEEEEDED